MIRTGFVGEDKTFNNTVILPIILSLISLILDKVFIKLLTERKSNSGLIDQFMQKLHIPKDLLPLE